MEWGCVRRDGVEGPASESPRSATMEVDVDPAATGVSALSPRSLAELVTAVAEAAAPAARVSPTGGVSVRAPTSVCCGTCVADMVGSAAVAAAAARW